MQKSYTLIVLILYLGTDVRAQKLEWLAGFDGFLDNREYFSIENPQTIFGARLRLEGGGSLAGIHSLRAGINHLYEFGHHIDAYKPDLTLYYQLQNGPFRLNLGAFPRRELLDFPLALLSDTLHYYRPNIEGAFLGFSWKWGRENVFIDWTSRQTDFAPEQFIFGCSGRMNWRNLFLTHHFMMAHMAGPAIPVPGQHLRDNGGFNVSLGADLSGGLFLDTLLIHAGALVSVDRIRGVDEGFRMPAGITGSITALYRSVGLTGHCYAGKGHTFLFGDPFYRLKRYGRLDLFYLPFRSAHVRIRFDLALHFARGQIDSSQQIAIYMNLDGSRPFQSNGWKRER